MIGVCRVSTAQWRRPSTCSPASRRPYRWTPDTPAQLISAGIAIHIGDPGYAALIVPRSGMGHRTGLVMGNLIGVLDADYMGSGDDQRLEPAIRPAARRS